MSKRLRKHNLRLPIGFTKADSSVVQALERGLKALNEGYYADAINLLERAAKHDAAALTALAEAHFRRALAPKTTLEQQLADLEKAVALAPNEATYHYHLGLTHHRRRELNLALPAYETAAHLEPRPAGLDFSWALAQIEANPDADLSDLSGLTPTERLILELLVRLARQGESISGDPAQFRPWLESLAAQLDGSNPELLLWRGLIYLLAGDAEAAHRDLEAAQPTAPRAQALRHYYLGISSAHQGDWSAAAMAWQQARARGLTTTWLGQNLNAVTLPTALAALRAGNWQSAADLARTALKASPNDPNAAQLAGGALDRLAHLAAGKGNWPQAAAHWAEAVQVYSASTKADNTTRTLWQNLAIAAEHAQAWEQAANAWRDLLRSRPRSKKTPGPFSESQWTWIRRRAILDLQKAGQLDQAITLLRQKVKAAPNDLAARFELVEALMLNQQEIAARNELERITQLDPANREAHLRLAQWHAQRQEWYAAELQVQEVLNQDPNNQPARSQMALLMDQRARSLHESGQVAAAGKVLQEALAFAPNNPELYIDLARVHLDLRQLPAARQDFEQAYRLGGKQISTHEQIIRCWIIERNRAEVDRALARVVQELQPPPLFYVHLGLACLSGGPPPNPFAPPSKPHRETEWEALGRSLIEQGISQTPDDLELLRHVIRDGLEAHTPLALPYAERLTQLTPGDPLAWVMLGILQTLANNSAAGKKSLKEAARVARLNGDHATAQAANAFRRELDNPLFPALFSLGLNLGPLADELDAEDLFDDDDSDEDLYPFLPRRSRRRK